jgi:hypothetical protein
MHIHYIYMRGLKKDDLHKELNIGLILLIFQPQFFSLFINKEILLTLFNSKKVG